MQKRALLATAALMPAALPILVHAQAGASAMTNKEVVALVGDAVFNKHDFSVLERHVKSGYIQHNPLVPQGREGFRRFFADTFRAVPDWRHQTKRVAEDGDFVWVHGTYKGTHQGEWLGIPATGKSFAFDAVDIFRIEGGQLAEHWDVMDVHGLLKQLGVID